jgi:hypothetical protein
MPLRDKYQPIVDLIKEMKGEVLRAEEERGYFVIEGVMDSEDEIELVKRKTEKINDIKADEIKLKLGVKQ